MKTTLYKYVFVIFFHFLTYNKHFSAYIFTLFYLRLTFYMYIKYYKQAILNCCGIYLKNTLLYKTNLMHWRNIKIAHIKYLPGASATLRFVSRLIISTR